MSLSPKKQKSQKHSIQYPQQRIWKQLIHSLRLQRLRKRIAERKHQQKNPGINLEKKDYGKHNYTHESDEDDHKKYMQLPEINNFNGQKLGPMLETFSPKKSPKKSITSTKNNQSNKNQNDQNESIPLTNLTVMEYKHLIASSQKKNLLLTPATNPQFNYKQQQDEQIAQKQSGFNSFNDIKKINSNWLLKIRKKNKELQKLNFSELENPKKNMMNILRQQIQQVEDEKRQRQLLQEEQEQEFHQKQRISEPLQKALQLKHNRYLYEKMSEENKQNQDYFYNEQNSLMKSHTFYRQNENFPKKSKRSVSLMHSNNAIDQNLSAKFKTQKQKTHQINQKVPKKFGREHQLLPPENENHLDTIFIDEMLTKLTPAEILALKKYQNEQYKFLSEQLTQNNPLFPHLNQINQKQFNNLDFQPGWWYSVNSYNQSSYKPISREGGAFVQAGNQSYLYGGMSSDVFGDLEQVEINQFGSKLISWKKQEILNNDRNFSPNFLYGHSINHYDGNLVVFGGERKISKETPKIKQVSCEVWFLNLQKKMWDKQQIQSAQITPRRHHAACIMGNYLIIYGGLDKKQNYLNDINYYHLQKQRWKTLKLTNQLPNVAYHTCAAVFHQFRKNSKLKFKQLTDLKLKTSQDIVYEGIYYFGGIDQNNYINGCLRVIEPDTQPLKWTEPNTQGPEPAPRYSHQMVFSDKLNILAIHGGKNDQNILSNYYLNDTYILQLYNMNWVKIKDFGSIPQPRYSGYIGFIDSKIFVFGGMNGQGYCNADVQILELDKEIIVQQYLQQKSITHKQKKLDDLIFKHDNTYYETFKDKRANEEQIELAQNDIDDLKYPLSIPMKEQQIRQIFVQRQFQKLRNFNNNKNNSLNRQNPVKTYMQLDLEYIENAHEKQFYQQFPELKEKILKGEYVDEDEYFNNYYKTKSQLENDKKQKFIEKKQRSNTLDTGINFFRKQTPPKSLKQPPNKLISLKLKTLQTLQTQSSPPSHPLKTPKSKLINAIDSEARQTLQQQQQQQQNSNYNNFNNSQNLYNSLDNNNNFNNLNNNNFNHLNSNPYHTVQNKNSNYNVSYINGNANQSQRFNTYQQNGLSYTNFNSNFYNSQKNQNFRNFLNSSCDQKLQKQVVFSQQALEQRMQGTTRTQLLQQKLVLERRANKNKEKQKNNLGQKMLLENVNLTEAKVGSFRNQIVNEKQQKMLRDEINGKINQYDEELVRNLA